MMRMMLAGSAVLCIAALAGCRTDPAYLQEISSPAAPSGVPAIFQPSSSELIRAEGTGEVHP